MKLPSIAELIGKKEEEREIFVSFVLGKNWIQAGLWQIVEGRGELIASGTTDSWQDTDSFVQAADDSLSSAIGSLTSPPQELQSVVFGLPSSWVEEGNIKQGRLQQLRALCEKLELKPSGFVVISEAIIHFLKNKEGAPLSCILVGMEEEELEVILVRVGKIVNLQTVSRSISLADDITEGLSRFGDQLGQPLAARIILFNRHKNILEEAVQTLLSWEWPTSFFLHTPRVDSLFPDNLLSAVSAAAAQEFAQVREFGPLETYEEEEKPKESLPTQEAQAEEFGFQEVSEQVAAQEMGEQEQMGKRFSVPFQMLGQALGKFKEATPSFAFLSRGRFLFVLMVAVLFGAILAWWFLPKAVLTVYVAPRKIEEKIVLTVDPTGKEAEGVLPGRVATLEVSGEKTKPTSGTKTVGERAKGEVTILNNTSQSRIFTPGTILTGPNGLKFTLGSQVLVASESGAPSYLPGQAKATVSAVDIGAEYNLASDSLFSLANFATSSFSAKNDTAFGGGSSREVAAVAAEDYKRLEEELIAEMTDKVKTQTAVDIRGNERVINESTRVNVSKRIFSAEIGEESQTLKLNITAQGQILVVLRDKLNSSLVRALSPKVPEGFSLPQEDLDTRFERVEEGRGLPRFQVNATVNLLPNIDTKALSQEIAGKSTSFVRGKLTGIPGFTRSTIKLSLSFPLLSNLPQRADNIKIFVTAEP